MGIDFLIEARLCVGLQRIEQRTCPHQHPCEGRYHLYRCYAIQAMVRGARKYISKFDAGFFFNVFHPLVWPTSVPQERSFRSTRRWC